MQIIPAKLEQLENSVHNNCQPLLNEGQKLINSRSQFKRLVLPASDLTTLVQTQTQKLSDSDVHARIKPLLGATLSRVSVGGM